MLVAHPSARTDWLQAIAASAKESGMPIELVTIGDGGDYRDVLHNWADVNGLDAGGAVLIRPDSFVGWRCATLPEDPAASLSHAVRSILGQVAPSPRTQDLELAGI